MMSGFPQLLRGAGQAAQHQHAVLVIPRGDELLRDQVHPVVQRAHDAEVRETIERDEARQLERGLVVVDRRRQGREVPWRSFSSRTFRSISDSIAL